VTEQKQFNDTSMLSALGSRTTEYDLSEPKSDIFECFENTTSRPYVINIEIPEWSGMCLAGDTLVDVACDESKFPKGIAIKDLVGTEGLVFSFDEQKNEPVVRKYYNVRKTRENSETVKVTFKKIRRNNDGKFETQHGTMVMTPDHPVLVQKGLGIFEWVLANDLKPSDQLVVEQRQGDYIRGKQRHRLIQEYLYGRKLVTEEHVHHVDLNHINNTPDNLEVLLMSDHFSLHMKNRYMWDDALDVEQLVLEYNNGANFHSLSKKYGCDGSTIYARIEHLVNKRTQSEALGARPSSIAKKLIYKECNDYYQQGYTIYELSSYYDVHATTIMGWVKKAGGTLRTAHETSALRKTVELSGLNHRVVSVEPGEKQDVYNMEVEDTECFFAEGIVVHNCPKTHQPDFAHISIAYVPRYLCIESKSLKLYTFSYRSYGCFMESTTNKFVDDIVAACNPYWVKVQGIFNPRGGIDLNVNAEYYSIDIGDYLEYIPQHIFGKDKIHVPVFYF